MSEFATTVAMWTGLEEDLEIFNTHLKELGYTEEAAEAFRIFCTPGDAVKYFKFPKNTHFQGIKVVPVSEYPTHMCAIVKSTEYLEE